MRTAIAGVLLLCALSSLRADIAPYPRPEMPRTSVTMTEEKLSIVVSGTVARVSVRFLMTGGNITEAMEVGFPGGAELRNFKASVDGSPVAVRSDVPPPDWAAWRYSPYGMPPVKGIPWRSWRTTVAAKRQRVIEVSYDFVVKDRPEMSWYAGPGKAECDQRLRILSIDYPLWTGAMWAGPIGRADIDVQFDRSIAGAVISAEPKGAVTTDRAVSWRLTKIEPDSDLSVSLYTTASVGSALDFKKQFASDHPDNGSLILAVGDDLIDAGRTAEGIALYEAFFARWSKLPEAGRKQSEEAFRIGKALLRLDKGKETTAKAASVAAIVCPHMQTVLSRAMHMGPLGLRMADVSSDDVAICTKYGFWK